MLSGYRLGRRRSEVRILSPRFSLSSHVNQPSQTWEAFMSPKGGKLKLTASRFRLSVEIHTLAVTDFVECIHVFIDTSGTNA